MDSDATYREILELVSEINDHGDYDSGSMLADKFQELDEWMKSGGYPPAAWHHPLKDDI